MRDLNNLPTLATFHSIQYFKSMLKSIKTNKTNVCKHATILWFPYIYNLQTAGVCLSGGRFLYVTKKQGHIIEYHSCILVWQEYCVWGWENTWLRFYLGKQFRNVLVLRAKIMCLYVYTEYSFIINSFDLKYVLHIWF